MAKSFEENIARLEGKRVLRDPMAFIADKRMLLDYTQRNLAALAERSTAQRRSRFSALCAALDAMSPLRVLARGYAVVRNEDGAVVRSARELAVGDTVGVTLGQGGFVCTVNKTTEENGYGEEL